jgi:TPR repeat protein
LLWQGDIAAARLALRRAAEAGNAQAARDLGMSFDPVFLHRIKAAAAPDLAQAASWYARAKELGLTDISRDAALAGPPITAAH